MALESNPENTVGIMTMAGMVTPTSDLGKIRASMHGLGIGGEMNQAAAIQVAQLALEHRRNKKKQQRIIVFARSVVKHEKKTLELIGRKLKKNNVALDIIDFGEEDEEKSEKLEALLAAVNNNDTSHIVHVPTGPSALSDVLISTPIFTGDGEGGSGFTAAGGVSGFFGVDPNQDPEPALALRVSVEEERARQDTAAKKAADDSSKQEKGGKEPSSAQDTTMTDRAIVVASDAGKSLDFMEDDNALLQKILAMSMDELAASNDIIDEDMSEVIADDPQLALALKMSLQEGQKASLSDKDMSKVLADQSFVSSFLALLPGVDPNDPLVRDLLASMQNQSEFNGESLQIDKLADMVVQNQGASHVHSDLLQGGFTVEQGRLFYSFEDEPSTQVDLQFSKEQWRIFRAQQLASLLFERGDSLPENLLGFVAPEKLQQPSVPGRTIQVTDIYGRLRDVDIFEYIIGQPWRNH